MFDIIMLKSDLALIEDHLNFDIKNYLSRGDDKYIYITLLHRKSVVRITNTLNQKHAVYDTYPHKYSTSVYKSYSINLTGKLA